MVDSKAKNWRTTSGKLGEQLIRHFLIQQQIETEDVGDLDLPYDLIVNEPDGNIFKHKAVIQVKTESKVAKLYSKYTFLPHRYQWEEMLQRKKDTDCADYEMWLALLWIRWENNLLQFKGCVCPEGLINNADFRPSIQRPSIYFWKIWEKSPIKFESTQAQPKPT